MKTYKKTALALAISTLLTQQAVAAQEAKVNSTSDKDLIEVIAVTASYEKSLEKAIDIKREAIGFTDSIVAGDIADIPEQNLAEALQRVPGIAIERSKGLGTKVNVRSLPSSFTHVSINNLATASGSGGRDVEFDIFASEVIQSVTVQKSPTAADEEGGIAGSVKISTARPFDYKGAKLIASVEGAYNSISEETDPEFAFLATNTWGNFGALASFSYSERTNRTDSNSGVDFRPMSRWLEKSGSESKQAQSDTAAAVLERDVGITIQDRFDENETERVVFLNKVGDRVYVNEQEKWGATVSLQFQPSDELSLTWDSMLGNYDSHEDEYDAAAYSASSRSTLERVHAYDDTTLAEHGIVVLTDASYALTQHEILSKERITETDYSQHSLTLDWTAGGWDIYGLVGYSGAERDYDGSNLKHTAYKPTRTRYTNNGGETIPSDNPDTFDMYNSPEEYTFEYYSVDVTEVSDDKYAAQLDFSRELNLELSDSVEIARVQFGARYTDKSKERNNGEIDVEGPAEGDSSWEDVRKMSESELQLVTDMVPGGSYLTQVSEKQEWQQVPNSYARETFRYEGFNVPFEPDQYYKVEEDVISLYAMADFSFTLANTPILLNTGVRYVDTNVNSYGFHEVQDATTGETVYTSEPVSKEGGYTEVLPSMNLIADLRDDLLLRAAASKTMMRPALGDIAYKRSVSYSDFKYFDGNPDLKPTYADQWEVGVEWYPTEGALFAASYFKKVIEGVVNTEHTGVVTDVTKYNANGTVDGVYDFDVYQKVNADGSFDVDGIELVAQFPLSMVHESLDGFGINSNYTMLDNSLTGSSDLDIPTPPTGLAETVFNATVYFENEVFDARVSYNYKDDYVEYVERDNYPVYRDAYGQVDISLGYQLTPNMKVSLKGINMTNEATTGYTMDPKFPSMYEFSGRRVSLGIRAAF